MVLSHLGWTRIFNVIFSNTKRLNKDGCTHLDCLHGEVIHDFQTENKMKDELNLAGSCCYVKCSPRTGTNTYSKITCRREPGPKQQFLF